MCLEHMVMAPRTLQDKYSTFVCKILSLCFIGDTNALILFILSFPNAFSSLRTLNYWNDPQLHGFDTDALSV